VGNSAGERSNKKQHEKIGNKKKREGRMEKR
jgi:hypothetical protein